MKHSPFENPRQSLGQASLKKRPNVMKQKLLEDKTVWEDDVRAVPKL